MSTRSWTVQQGVRRYPGIFVDGSVRNIKCKRGFASSVTLIDRTDPLVRLATLGRPGVNGGSVRASIVSQKRYFRASSDRQEPLSCVKPPLAVPTASTNPTLRSSFETSKAEPLPSSPWSPSAIVVVDNEASLKEMLLKMQDLPVKPPSLYVDAEGDNLGRKGTLALLQILALPLRCTFVIDIHVLKHAAFTTCASDSTTTTTLKTILESNSTPKVIFDARNDSDNLFTEYGICLGGVRDLQLMEYFSRPRDPGFTVLGLSKCIERHLHAGPDVVENWKLQKEHGKRLYSPKLGGSTRVFFNRPLSSNVLAYAAGDVEYMSMLYHKYRQKLPPGRWKWVLEKSRKRVKTSHVPTYALSYDRRWIAPTWTGKWDQDAAVPRPKTPRDISMSSATASTPPTLDLTKAP